jgi:hypothetical protein
MEFLCEANVQKVFLHRMSGSLKVNASQGALNQGSRNDVT